MFEDLQPRISRKDLKEKIEEMRKAISESRDYISDRHVEIDVLKNFYHDAFNDAKRFSKVLKEVCEVIKDKNLQDDFENTGIDGLVNE